MDKIEKLLSKLTKKERTELKTLLEQVQKNNLQNLDLKKLKGNKNIFRVRKGNIRIIIQIKKEEAFLLAIERRSEKTYRDL